MPLAVDSAREGVRAGWRVGTSPAFVSAIACYRFDESRPSADFVSRFDCDSLRGSLTSLSRLIHSGHFFTSFVPASSSLDSHPCLSIGFSISSHSKSTRCRVEVFLEPIGRRVRIPVQGTLAVTRKASAVRSIGPPSCQHGTLGRSVAELHIAGLHCGTARCVHPVILKAGYLLDSGSPNMLWSGSRCPAGVRGLKKLAEETGNGYFELEKTADLAPTFTRELRGQRGSADRR